MFNPIVSRAVVLFIVVSCYYPQCQYIRRHIIRSSIIRFDWSTGIVIHDEQIYIYVIGKAPGLLHRFHCELVCDPRDVYKCT